MMRLFLLFLLHYLFLWGLFGPFSALAGVKDIQVLDPERDKTLPVRIRYPDQAEGPYPLIMFSHGAGGSGEAFADLSRELAENGYVVMHPTHSDSIRLRRRQGTLEGKLEGMQDADLRAALADVTQDVKLRDRARDFVFLIDNIARIEEKLGLKNLIDAARIGMAGHSAGALTTQALAGVKFYPGRSRRARGFSLKDPRIDAFAIISGQGTSLRALRPSSWADIGEPWLVFTGSRDTSPLTAVTPAERREPYEYAPGTGNKYLVFIEGTTHSAYQGEKAARLLDSNPPENTPWIEHVTSLSTRKFFDAYLKNDSGALNWLNTGRVLEVSYDRMKGELAFSRK